jgi:hypothetical protein
MTEPITKRQRPRTAPDPESEMWATVERHRKAKLPTIPKRPTPAEYIRGL